MTEDRTHTKNRNSRRKKKKSPIPVIIMILMVLLITAGAIFIYNRYSETYTEMNKMDYYGMSSEDQAPLVVNDIVLDQYGLVLDGEIYIAYDTVITYFNSGFYWENETEQMLLTMPDNTLIWSPGTAGDAVISEDGTIYVSASCVMENSDIDMTIAEGPDRVIARTSWTNLTYEQVLEDTVVRYRGGPKSEILTDVHAGDIVVLTSNADDWCEVSTSDGYIGYVKKSDIEAVDGTQFAHETDEKFIFDLLSVDYSINMTWQYCETDSGVGALTELIANADGLNTISPTWFRFSDGDGSLDSLASAEYVEAAHAAGLQVWGALQDVYSSEYSTADILANYDTRQKIITQLLDACDETGMDGINIDIETITEESVPQYLQFLRELSIAAHRKSVIISVDNYVLVYTSYLNRTEQAKVVDYLVIMGYDEHTAGSAEAGSVASLDFVEQGITDTLTEVSADQVINAIPFYSRGWMQTTGEEIPSSEALGMNSALEWASQYGIELTWDSSVGQLTGSTTIGDTTYSIWVENDRSVEEKMKLIQKYNLAGAASWRLGLEDSSVWPVIAQYLAS